MDTQLEQTGETTTNACPICGAARRVPFMSGLVRCSTCGLVSADLSLSDEELRELYGERYFFGHEYRNYVEEESDLKLNFSRRLADLAGILGDLKNLEIFEIGCAYGFFLEEAALCVGKASGIDISSDAVRYARETRGVHALAGDYLQHRLDHPVDLIAMWDVIEHLPRPDLFIRKAAADLKPGGHIAITTGDIGSLNARLRGRRWRMIHPPTHLHYFSVAALERLLSRHNFEVIHVAHPGNSRHLKSILYSILVLRWGWKFIFNALAALPLLRGSITINLRDIVFVIARRKPDIEAGACETGGTWP
jgi:2-polyprenyl-3-methyl-5-hydroxy-6-metoxy-1,4-benzoquinol methylase